MRKRSSNFRYCYAIILGLIGASAHASTFFNDSQRGWFFYESKPIESIESMQRSLNPTKTQTPGEKAESELNTMKQQLAQASALALLYPTPENVWSYQEMKTKVYNMAGVLTDQQMRNEWTRPDSYSANTPTGGEGLEMDRKELNHCSEDMIRQSANTYGMFLFTSKNCKYCNAQVGILQDAKRRYGMSTMVISFDGSKPDKLGDMPFGIDSGKLSKQFGIKNDGKPVTVMFDAKSGKSQLLGYGYITIDNLNNRICRLYTKSVGEF